MNRTEREAAKDYAYETYCTDDIALADNGTEPLEGEEGCWVAAWLWVPKAALVQRRDEEVRDA